MYTVKQISELTGVSIKTLHHYHKIGLLIPEKIADNNYRYYSDKSVETLHSILLFKELEFSLKDIKEILNSPNFDKKQALQDQINLLKLKREKLDNLIKFTEKLKQGGNMNFKEFDNSKIEQYKKEAKEKWGNTKEYKESQEKEKKRGKYENMAINQGLMEIFKEFGAIMQTKSENSKEAQSQVVKLQNYITKNYYNCTKEILSNLGLMYVNSPEFKENIDKAGGNNCAKFVSKSIEIYCTENNL